MDSIYSYLAIIVFIAFVLIVNTMINVKEFKQLTKTK